MKQIGLHEKEMEKFLIPFRAMRQKYCLPMNVDNKIVQRVNDCHPFFGNFVAMKCHHQLSKNKDLNQWRIISCEGGKASAEIKVQFFECMRKEKSSNNMTNIPDPVTTPLTALEKMTLLQECYERALRGLQN
jgi:hypothetical protein